MNKIVVKLNGGIGNQFFQYATAYTLAKRWGLELELHVCCPPSGSGHYLQYRLDLVNISTKAVLQNLAWKIVSSRKKQIARVAQILRKITGVVLLEETTVHKRDARLFSPAPEGRVLYLKGYWQVPSYFEECRAELLKEFSFRAEPFGRNLDMIRRIQNTPGAVSLHIRRGDYLTINGAPVLPLSYYQEAIQKMQEKIDQPAFFVFSDDIRWAESTFRDGVNFVFVDINGTDSGQEDLRLMAACKHHIIANSSFSWWGAWLDPSEEKTVIAPKYWMMIKETFFPELFPESWIIIDNMKTKV